jgi:hypothetical protein
MNALKNDPQPKPVETLAKGKPGTQGLPPGGLPLNEPSNAASAFTDAS